MQLTGVQSLGSLTGLGLAVKKFLHADCFIDGGRMTSVKVEVELNFERVGKSVYSPRRVAGRTLYLIHTGILNNPVAIGRA